MAVTVTAPKTTPSATKPEITSLVKVEIQNRGQHDEVIADDHAQRPGHADLHATSVPQSGTPPVPAARGQAVEDAAAHAQAQAEAGRGARRHRERRPRSREDQGRHQWRYTWSTVDHTALTARTTITQPTTCAPQRGRAVRFRPLPDGTIMTRLAAAVRQDAGGQIVTDVVVKEGAWREGAVIRSWGRWQPPRRLRPPCSADLDQLHLKTSGRSVRSPAARRARCSRAAAGSRTSPCRPSFISRSPWSIRRSRG